MTLEQMEAIATDLQTRVTALEERPADSIGVPNIYKITNTGVESEGSGPPGIETEHEEGKEGERGGEGIPGESGASGMVFRGFWLPEPGYPAQSVVLYAEKEYVCYKATTPKGAPLGPGPTHAAIGWGQPGFKHNIKPRGRIASGIESGAMIWEAFPNFEDFNASYHGPPGEKILQLGCVCFEIWWEGAGEITALIKPEGEKGPTEEKPGDFIVKAAFFLEESGIEKTNRAGEKVFGNAGGIFRDGVNPAKIVIGGKEAEGLKRGYIVIDGCVRERQGPPFTEYEVTLPFPVSILVSGGHVVNGPSNPPPPKDPEHWIELP